MAAHPSSELTLLPCPTDPTPSGFWGDDWSDIRSTRHQPPWNSQLQRKISPDTNNLANSWPAATLLFLRKVIEEAVLEQGQLCLDLERCL